MRFPLFLSYSFDDDLNSSKRHVGLLSLTSLLKCLSKSFFIKKILITKKKPSPELTLSLYYVCGITHRTCQTFDTKYACKPRDGFRQTKKIESVEEYEK